jgi:sorbitol/mannitol transport system substrate-binding protein
VPEFQDLGNQVSQDIADVFAGRDSVESVLDKGQDLATDVGDAQK